MTSKARLISKRERSAASDLSELSLRLLSLEAEITDLAMRLTDVKQHLDQSTQETAHSIGKVAERLNERLKTVERKSQSRAIEALARAQVARIMREESSSE